MLTDIMFSKRSQYKKNKYCTIYMKFKNKQNQSMVIDMRITLGVGQLLKRKDHRELSGVRTGIILFLDLGGGYKSVFIHKNSVSSSLQVCVLYCNLHLNKTVHFLKSLSALKRPPDALLCSPDKHREHLTKDA